MTRPPRSFVFVMEQMLGHVVHTANLQRAAHLDPDISATLIRVAPRPLTGARRLPAIRTWSFQASSAARAAVRRRLAQGPADALFIHTQVAALRCAGVMRRIPTVVSLDATPLNYDTVGESYGHHRSPAAVEWVKWRINTRTLAAARALVTWSRWAADSVVNDYRVPAERVHVIRPGVDLERFHPAERDNRDGPVRVLFVGGDFARKGGHDLLAAVGSLGDSIELDIVSPTAPDRCRTLPGVRVHPGLGHRTDTLHDLYRRADIFALPTHGDCLPLVVAEALASGLPIVTCGVGALSEAVRDGWNGFVVPPRCPEGLAQALRTLIEHPEQRRSMGSRSRRLACDEHDSARNNRAIIALMREICGERGRLEPARVSCQDGADHTVNRG